jgi:phage shock protein A
MFDELRAAFREALENFNKELSRDNVSDTADRLLVGMKREIVDEKAAVAGVGAELEKTRSTLERLSAELATARRREEMARGIEDEETVRLAAEFATKAEAHIAVLRKKEEALAEEFAFRQHTVEEMFARFHEAKEKRDALTSTTQRTGARGSISAADDLFDELDRMADKIEGTQAAAEAAEAFDDLDLDAGSDVHVDYDRDAPPTRELDVDAALAELKRRMREG